LRAWEVVGSSSGLCSMTVWVVLRTLKLRVLLPLCFLCYIKYNFTN